MSGDNTRSVGVFDSGIGGLTVVHELMRRLPQENIIYFGDTARVPYGSKSADVVRQYGIEDARLLVEREVKMIVVACNTVSAIALDDIRHKYKLPVVGVIIPGAKAAAAVSKKKKIGVIGTRATIAANAYTRELHAIDKSISVFSQPCPLFVPIAEEDWENHRATELIADEYLVPLRGQKIDTLILGCTHYPLLKSVIRKSIGENVVLIDSGKSAAEDVDYLLDELHLKNTSNPRPTHQFMVSDIPQKFQEIAERFLGMPVGNVLRVDAAMHEI